jgi:TonB family protein
MLLILASIGCKPASPSDSATQNDASGLRGDWSRPAVGCTGMPAGVLDFGALQAITEPGGSKSSASRVAAGLRAGMQACYEGLLARDARAEGIVRLELLLDCDGSVRSVHAEASGVDEEAMRCAMEAARGSRFPAPAEGSGEIRVPVSFVQRHSNAAAPGPDASR